MKCTGLQIWSAEVGREQRQQHTPHTNIVTCALHVSHYCKTVCVSAAGTVYIAVTLHVHSPPGTLKMTVTLYVQRAAGTQ
jgi:hypothetical protein